MSSLIPVQAERAVLGALMLNMAGLPVVQAILPSPQAFGIVEHRHVYAAMLSISSTGQPVDHVTLPAELERVGMKPDAIGDVLNDCADEAHSGDNIAAHAHMVRNFARRRDVLAAAQAAVKAASDVALPLEATISATVEALVKPAQDILRRPTPNLRTGLYEVMAELEERANRGPIAAGISSGMGDLDRLTDGWRKGELILLAGRPSRGKTSLSLKFAREAAEQGPVHFASREMGWAQLMERLLASEAYLNTRSAKSRSWLEMHAPSLARAAGALADLPIEVDEASATPGALRVAVQQTTAKYGGIGLVVVDYLQMLRSGERSGNRVEEIGLISRKLKRLAVECDVPVIALSQLSRANVKDGGRRPVLSDLRDSGDLEQDADMVLFVHRAPEFDDTSEQWPEGKVELIVAKHRNGPTGHLDVHFDRQRQRWTALLEGEAA